MFTIIFITFIAILNLINFNPQEIITNGDDNFFLFGGDVFLARQTHLSIEEYDYDWPLNNISDWIESADFNLINLECVISNKGRPCFKGEKSPYYFRARPDMINILSESGIEIITGANNHAGDYGDEALLEEMNILDQACIGYVGIGRNLSESRGCKIFKAGNITIGLIGIDMTQSTSKAKENQPGTNWLDEEDIDNAVEVVQNEVNKARRFSDIVFLTIHWGANGKSEPTENRRKLASRFIREAEVDCILGHSAHLFQGVEIIDEKPVIYDAGNLLLDYNGEDWYHKSLLFKLRLEKQGVTEIELLPIRLFKSHTTKANSYLSQDILTRFSQLCKKLGTDIFIQDNKGYILLKPIKNNSYLDKEKEEFEKIPCLPVYGELKSNVILEELPKNINPLHVIFSPGIELLGYRLDDLEKRKNEGFFITTYWKTIQKISDSYVISIQLVPQSYGPIWDNDDSIRNHEPGDWSYPTQLWQPGEIIEDYFFVRANKQSAIGLHDIYISLIPSFGLNEELKITSPNNLKGENRVFIGKINIIE